MREALTLLVLLFVLASARAESPALPQHMRRPVALAFVDERCLLVANRRSGSISIVDANKQTVVAEAVVGKQLADLAVVAGGQRVLAVDEADDQLLVLEFRDNNIKLIRRVPVAAAPVSVRINQDGTRCFVACLWSRILNIVDVGEGRVVARIPLPFNPRRQALTPDGSKLIVADAFGGKLAVVDAARGTILSMRSVPAHNIGGLSWSRDGRELHVTHQILNPLARTTFEDIHWGNLIRSNVRVIPLATLLDPKADLARGSRLEQIGDVGLGSGDPAGIAIDASGKRIVALSGVHEIALGPNAEGSWSHVSVGHGPSALVLGPDGTRAFVANTFSDSISVVSIENRAVEKEIDLGPKVEPSLADRGEMLFHDARLAHGSWFSCHSCHTDGHGNGQLADTLGDESYSDPKRVLTLRGVADTGPWAWNGKMPDLESQTRKSIESTMHGKARAADVTAIVAFLKTLPPVRVAGDGNEASARRGAEIFTSRACATCHKPPTFTSAGVYDVGLADEMGRKSFNPPSLRGVGQGGPYFHDNRAATLEDVFVRYRHQLKAELTKEELVDLLSYLRSL